MPVLYRSRAARCALALLCLAAAPGILAAAQPAPGAPPTRDLVIARWLPDRWAATPGQVQPNMGKTPLGEPLARITLVPGDTQQSLLTLANVPATATRLTMFLHQTAVGSGKHVALFSDSHGWSGGGNVLWGLQGDTNYETRIAFGSWRVGFFHSQLTPPYRFRGFAFQGRDAKAAAGRPVTVDAGPVHVEYTPDDTHWLYADMQPKVIPMRNGVLPPLTLRVANLGTQPHTFRFALQPVERSLTPVTVPPVSLGRLTLAPGEARDIPATLPVHTLGWWKLRYRADSAGAPALFQDETLSVVNAFDHAEGFRQWAAHRRWFSVPDRRLTVVPGKAPTQVPLTVAANGVSPVPLFPVEPRVPPPAASAAAVRQTVASGRLTLLSSQLSPAWLLHSTDRALTLFGGTRLQALGGPTHVAFATPTGTVCLARGRAAAMADLRRMSQPWLLVWWQGSDGWTTFDAPFLVVLQHRPASLRLQPDGVVLTFAQAAGDFSMLPLDGYAKLPQLAAWQRHPEQFKLPASWPAAALHTWTWDQALPAAVVNRCRWWSSALARIPTNVHETFEVNHTDGAIHVHDRFDYLDVPSDWKLSPHTLAPLSPSLALAIRSGFPAAVAGTVTDLQYPTIFGPYSAVEGATGLDYTLKLGPYWMQAADPNPAAPADASTPARRAQRQLLGWGRDTQQDNENQMWDWQDENFVWYAQGQADRDPANATGYAPAGRVRNDLKYWQQGRTLYTLLNPARYKLDERQGTLTRRYIDGPGIGNWGSSDWGDSGKLGTDMVLDAYDYAYHTGDYQTIADRWDVLTSLASLPTSQSWITMGRGAISELGDQAPTMLALARLAYAVGDQQEYVAALFWWARELVTHVVKEGALTTWRNQFQPWNSLNESPVITGTNLWGTNAGWVDGGMRLSDGQWNQFPTRLDDPDTLRFMQRYRTTLPRMNRALSTPAERKGDEANNPSKKNAHGGPDAYPLYFDRVAILGESPAAVAADFVQGDPYISPPESLAFRLTAAWHEFPPRLEFLIPASTPTMNDTGFAWNQSNNASYGLVNPPAPAERRLPTLTWFWWKSPATMPGVDSGDKWSFGSVDPAGHPVPAAIQPTPLSPETVVYRWTLRPPLPLDRFPAPLAALVSQANLPPAQQTALADAWEAQASIPVLLAGPFANPGGGMNTGLVHGPESAYLGGQFSAAETYADTLPEGTTVAAGDWQPGRVVRWQQATLTGGAIDFLHQFPQVAGHTNDAAYVYVAVRAPAAMSATLRTGSDDGLKVWVNRQMVFDHPATRGLKIDDDTNPVPLQAGWNTLLLKVPNGDGGWALALRVADSRGLPIPGLEFSTEAH